MKQLAPFLIGFFLAISSYAQSIDNYFSSQESTAFQKLYLHTDREYYFVGDTLWFSPYLLLANNNELLADDCNLYVELIDSKGQIVEEKNFLLDKGICSGYLSFNNEIITAGTYILRAYTDHLKPLGGDAFFRKTIKINNVRHKKEEEILPNKERGKVFLDFYPEGGFLLDGKVNQMAFIAHNQDGQTVNIKGKLLSADGEQIPINTTYKGVGSFMFIPKSGQKYKIETDAHKNVQFRMPDFRPQGAKLMLTKVTDKAISLYIISSDNLPSNEFYIALFHRGKGINYVKVEKDKLTQPISIRTDYLGAGVNRLVLLNAQFEPLSERLVFINNNSDDCLVKINVGKDKLQTREQVKMKLSIPEIQNDDEWARLSVSVVSENMVGYKGNLLDIRSYLLLDSELKGQVQTPGLYFIDDDSVSSARKLDLLMLTNGWRNYKCNSVKEKGDVDVQISSPGFTFSGNVKKEIANKPYVNTDVYLNIANKDIRKLRSTKTNQYGCFEFDSIVFFDTTMVMIQAKNYKDKNNTRLELSYQGLEHFPVDESKYEHIEDIGSLSYEMYRLKYMNELALTKFFPDRESKVLKEINVIAEKKENTDTHFRFYGTASQSKKLTDSDRNYQNVFQYLSGRFAGVRVIDKNTVLIRGGGSINSSNDPLYLLDGMPIDAAQLEYIPMYEIDVVEVIEGPDATIFGVRGANGVISIFTRTDADYKPTAKEIPGTIIKKMQGFEKLRVFYSPVYVKNNIDSEIPDYRQTLYWNPEVVIDDDIKPITFFTCDNLANYKIFVEGITTSGKICMGEAGFVVNERR